MSTHILGIRHHGPGSARNVREFLERTKPDIVLVEGPPDAEHMLQWVTSEGMTPPVALLVYQPDNLARSVFYPFAEFSPEWQAICYAREHNIHVRFMDLPVAHSFALRQAAEHRAKDDAAGTPESAADDELLSPSLNNATDETAANPFIYNDPIRYLAEAAGYTDGEKWWEHFFEHRANSANIFDAVAEAMQSLRDTLPRRDEQEENLREAWMRKTIRQAEKEMFSEIAVICGAWHVPALKNMPKAKEDNELLKGLPKVKVECTWVPWSYSRLSYFSGYGAGIQSPGWYAHIWQNPHDDGTRWMAKVAALFREQQMDTSVAHVIEGVRLAAALASLRGLPKAGLEELNEATLSVLCNGEPVMMQLIHDKLIVSNTLGHVPADIPKPPLQADIERTQKKLRLQPSADHKDLTLDLRNDNDLERSIFLHRLLLLDIGWGTRSLAAGKGTFKEQWRLQWEPSLSIEIIEKGNWGNTVAEAATRFANHNASASSSLRDVSALLESAIAAALPQTVESIILCINDLAASSGDVMQLIEAVPSLVNVIRYGDVRKTDTQMVLNIVNGLTTRICISLPVACTSLNEDAAQILLDLLYKMNDAIGLLQDSLIKDEWQKVLFTIAANPMTSPLIGGYTTRLMFDNRLLTGEALISKFAYAMSPANPHAIVSSWLEGFLKGSGMILLLDDELWAVIDNWVDHLDQEAFTACLPVLRRTFATFNATERKKLGEKAKQAKAGGAKTQATANEHFNTTSAGRGLPVIMTLLNIPLPPNN